MKATGASPLNINWLDEHADTCEIADVALSTGIGSNNAELISTAVAEDTTSLVGVETYCLAKQLLRHPKLPSLLENFEQRETDLDSQGFLQVNSAALCEHGCNTKE
jgi:hypothetical protein